MKNMKKILLLMTCALILVGATACSSKDDTYNGADQTTDDNAANGNDTANDNNTVNDTDDRTMNDATEGNGVLNDAVDDVTDGVDRVTDDVTDGVDRATDDMTENNGAEKDTNNNR